MGSVFSPTGSGRNGTGPTDEDLHRQIRALISSLLYQESCRSERRRQLRYAFPKLMYVTPLGDAGMTPIAESIVAIGKDLSENGLGFYHTKPLDCSRTIVSLRTGGNNWGAFVIDLKRTRPIQQDWYESGGRFVQSLPIPADVVAHIRDANH